jgi:tetratricopeptide (TPR) repeat protein
MRPSLRCGLLLWALLATAPAAAGLLRDGDPNRGLEPVPAPDTSRLSEAVRISLASVEAEFDRLAATRDESALGLAYGRLGMRYQSHQLDGSTGPAYRNAISLDPAEFRWQYFLGFLYHEVGEFDAARASYERAHDLMPDYAPLQLRAAIAALDAERIADARERLRAYGAAHPDEAAALAALGEIAALDGQHQQAVNLYRRALELAPYADQLYYPLALSLRRTGDAAGATAAMAQRGERGPAFADPELSAMQALSRSPAFFNQRGQEAVAAGRDDEALLMFQTAVEIYPDSVPARNALALMLVQLEDYDAAADQLARALELDPTDGRTLAATGSLAEIAGNDAAALAYFERWVAADGSADARFRAGNAALRLGRYRQARATFQALLAQIEGAAPQIVSKLAITMLASEDCDGALSLLAAQTAPEPLMWRSRALATCPGRSEDEHRAALEMADALVRLYPNVATYVTRALALGGTGDYPAATELVRQILFQALRSGETPAEAALLQEALAAFEARMPAPHALTADGPYLSPAATQP